MLKGMMHDEHIPHISAAHPAVRLPIIGRRLYSLELPACPCPTITIFLNFSATAKNIHVSPVTS